MSVLSVTNLEKNFGENRVLRDISFSLEKGEVLSIIGSSGSGKSTLLRCIAQLETANGGSVAIGDRYLIKDGVYTDKVTARELQKRVGMVFQSFNLFPHFTVLRNITDAPVRILGVSKEDAEKTAMTLLERMNLADRASSYPCELSGGQQQRVAIARALAMKPDILCFDEPTSALDPELTGEVLKVIRSLKDGNSTMIVVTHEMEFARMVSDKCIFMANGVIEEAGTPDEVFLHPTSEKTVAFLGKSLENRF